MKFSATMLIVFSAVIALTPPAAFAGEPCLESVFNGKDLKGWTVEPESQKKAWSVKQGVLQLKSLPDKKGSTLWTDKDYGSFTMTFDFKFGEGTIDTGIYLHTTKEQIQIGESGSLKRDMTGSPYIAGKGYPQEAEGVAKLLKKTEWNSMKIEVNGNVYTVWLNGTKVITYESDTALRSGKIGIQLHGNVNMTAYYRNIKIAEKK